MISIFCWTISLLDYLVAPSGLWINQIDPNTFRNGMLEFIVFVAFKDLILFYCSSNQKCSNGLKSKIFCILIRFHSFLWSLFCINSHRNGIRNPIYSIYIFLREAIPNFSSLVYFKSRLWLMVLSCIACYLIHIFQFVSHPTTKLFSIWRISFRFTGDISLRLLSICT